MLRQILGQSQAMNFKKMGYLCNLNTDLLHFVRYNRDFQVFVRYKHETLCIKFAKPNQTSWFVRYNLVFAITVIVITEFDCNLEKKIK
jgi:hypothetical protein